MKLYDYTRAPNPRRVRMFMAEKGVAMADIEVVQVDIVAGDNLSDGYRHKNPMHRVPMLELDDGTYLSESVAISRYFESVYPDPPLFGRNAREQALVDMWNRRMEQNLLFPVGMAFRNLTGAFRDRERVCSEWGEICHAEADNMFDFLDQHLAENTYISGDTFTIADITAVCAVDFARVIKLRIGENQTNLQRWHETVSTRHSATA